jgi:hypothetical protein
MGRSAHCRNPIRQAPLRARAFGAGYRRWRSALHSEVSAERHAHRIRTAAAPLSRFRGGRSYSRSGSPGFAGYFLGLLEEPGNRGGPWTIAITFAFGGEHGDVLIVARRGRDEIRRQGQPVEAAVEVFKEAMSSAALAA